MCSIIKRARALPVLMPVCSRLCGWLYAHPAVACAQHGITHRQQARPAAAVHVEGALSAACRVLSGLTDRVCWCAGKAERHSLVVTTRQG